MAALVLREVGWSWFPAELQGMASKGLGAVLVLVFLCAVWRLSSRSGWLTAAVAYGAWGALQTVICSVVGICSARIDFDLGALGLLAAARFALKASPVSSCRFHD